MNRCRHLRLLPAAAVLALFVPVGAEAQCPDGSPPPCSAAPRRVARAAVTPPSVDARRKSFLVLPFRNLTRSPDHDWLVEGSPVLIADALSRADSVRVVPDERLYPALERAGLTAGGVMDLGRVRRVAEETGGWTAVTGEIMAIGNRLRVSARAFDVVSNAEVMRAVEEAPTGDDVRAIYERLGTRLVRATGSTGEAASLATTTTKSVDAYRAYVRGVSHQNRSEARRARDAFLEAVRLDSTYAQAYARLAETEINLEPRQVSNLQSPLYRYANRAAALADNLGPRDREVVLAMHDWLSGRFASSRERVTRLLAEDSLRVDALERLTALEMFDPVLVDQGGVRRPRGSYNRALALAKRVLELDPARHTFYGSLVQTYLLFSGLAPGYVLGYEREASSLPAMFATVPAATFFPLLRDTVELVPTDAIHTVHPDTIRAARARAVDAARQWVNRWLAVGKGQAEPHLWASRVHSQAGDFEAALRELNTADSIGVESGLENVPARRMSLLARLGRYAQGRAIADSLFASGVLNVATGNAYLFEGAGWAYMLFLLDGEYERAEMIHQQFAAAFAANAAQNPDLTPEGLAMLILTGAVPQFFSAPSAVRLTVLERVLADALVRPPSSSSVRLLPFHAMMVSRDTGVARAPLGQAILAAAGALASAGRTDLAQGLSVVAGRDTALRRTMANLPWHVSLRENTRAAETALVRRFRATRAVVTDSAATFHWTVEPGPFTWNRPENLGAYDFIWEATVNVAGGEWEILADVTARPALAPETGDLAALLRRSVPSLHEIVSPDTTVPHRVASRTAVRIEGEPGGFRLALRDPRLVAALRRERPATARMEMRPCGSACRIETIRITYP